MVKNKLINIVKNKLNFRDMHLFVEPITMLMGQVKGSLDAEGLILPILTTTSLQNIIHGYALASVCEYTF